jgi:hypothetical protein
MNTADDLDLETYADEYLALVAAGDAQAMQYALAEAESGSERFGQEVLTTLMSLMRLVGPGSSRDPEFHVKAAEWVRGAREDLLQAIAEHVAPVWAYDQYHRQRAKYRRVVGERAYPS